MTRKNVTKNLHGFLNVNKPAGVISRRVTDIIQGSLKYSLPKPGMGVGHVGTLDPAADGVLPVAIGKANKFLPYLRDDKEYRAVIKFGVSTSTADMQGVVTEIRPVPHLDHAAVENSLHEFVGNVIQLPPASSAVKIGGQRAYNLAREIGHEAVDIRLKEESKSRQVRVDNVEVNGWCPGTGCQFPELTATIVCGTGTYIRSIARDVGAAVGDGNGSTLPSTLAQLQRVRSNGFSLSTAVPLQKLHSNDEIQRNLLPCDTPLLHLPGVVLSHRRLGGLSRVAQGMEGSGSCTSLIVEDPVHLAVLFRRWAMKAAPSWAVFTAHLNSPASSRAEGVAALEATVQGLREGRQSEPRKMVAQYSAGTGVDRSHLVRAYVLTTRRALSATGVPHKPVASALPDTVLMDLVGATPIGIGPAAVDDPNARVLAFLGLGRIHTLLRAYWDGGGKGGDASASQAVTLELTVERLVSMLDMDVPSKGRSTRTESGVDQAVSEGRR